MEVTKSEENTGNEKRQRENKPIEQRGKESSDKDINPTRKI